MELVSNKSEQLKPVVFDVSQLDERLRDSPLYLHFLARRASFGGDKRAYDLTAACVDGIDEEGNLNMDLLASIELAFEHLEGHEGEPVAFVQTVTTDTIKKIDATIGVLAPDRAVAGILGYGSGGAGLYSLGTPYSLNAYNTRDGEGIHVERSVPLDHSQGVVPFHTHEVKIGQPYVIQGVEVATAHEVIVGDEIIPWIKATFGETPDGYRMYVGFLQALRANGSESYLNDAFFVKTLAREHQVEKMTQNILNRHLEIERDIQATLEPMLADNRTETEKKLARVAEFSGDLLPVLESVRNGNGSVLSPLTSENWYPVTPEERLKLIDWRLKHVDPGSLELPVLE